MIQSILVVCLGNTCRSPMAADLLRQALPDCRVESAGLDPPVGAAADPRAIRLLAQEGRDIGSHRARAINNALISGADLVLVMDSEQRIVLESQYPEARGKIHRLCEAVQTDVPDPHGCSQAMFVIVLGLIRRGVEAWTAQLHMADLEGRLGEAS